MSRLSCPLNGETQQVACFATSKPHPRPPKRETIRLQEPNSITRWQWKLLVLLHCPLVPLRCRDLRDAGRGMEGDSNEKESGLLDGDTVAG